MDCKSAEQASRDVMRAIDLNGSKDISFSGNNFVDEEFLLGATDLKKVITF